MLRSDELFWDYVNDYLGTDKDSVMELFYKICSKHNHTSHCAGNPITDSKKRCRKHGCPACWALHTRSLLRALLNTNYNFYYVRATNEPTSGTPLAKSTSKRLLDFKADLIGTGYNYGTSGDKITYCRYGIFGSAAKIEYPKVLNADGALIADTAAIPVGFKVKRFGKLNRNHIGYVDTTEHEYHEDAVQTLFQLTNEIPGHAHWNDEIFDYKYQFMRLNKTLTGQIGRVSSAQ